MGLRIGGVWVWMFTCSSKIGEGSFHPGGRFNWDTRHTKPIIPLYLFKIAIFIFLVEGIIVKVNDPTLWRGSLGIPSRSPEGPRAPFLNSWKRSTLDRDDLYINYTHTYTSTVYPTTFLQSMPAWSTLSMPVIALLILDPRTGALDWLRGRWGERSPGSRGWVLFRSENVHTRSRWQKLL